MTSPLTIITTYYNFNQNPWIEQNTRHCARQWRRAGAHVILVEFGYSEHTTEPSATNGTTTTTTTNQQDKDKSPPPPYAFHSDVDEGPDAEKHVCNTLLQCTVNDIMWYKEMGVNMALSHLPTDCSLVGIFDNDILFVPPPDMQTSADTAAAEDTWWVEQIQQAFAQSPQLSVLQPFQQVALTTENVRTALTGTSSEAAHHTTDDQPAFGDVEGTELGESAGGDRTGEAKAVDASPSETSAAHHNHHPTQLLSLDDAFDRCERMFRVRPGIFRDHQNGVVGCAWVVRRHVLSHTPLFAETVTGGGEALMLNLWQGAVSTAPHGLPVCGHHEQQRYYFGPKSTFARAIRRHHKRLQHNVRLPLHAASLPLMLVHLYHGELATKRTHDERHLLLRQRRFQVSRDLIAHPAVPGLLRWSDAMRTSGINAEFRCTLERSHSVREKALLRIAKVRKCMDTLRTQVAEVVSTERTMAAQEGTAHAELSQVMRMCLEAFGK